MIPIEVFSYVGKVLTRTTSPVVTIGNAKFPVRMVGTYPLRLKAVNFKANNRNYIAIQQNPSKDSRWGELARKGANVVQFKNTETDRYVGVYVDGKVIDYANSSNRGPMRTRSSRAS